MFLIFKFSLPSFDIGRVCSLTCKKKQNTSMRTSLGSISKSVQKFTNPEKSHEWVRHGIDMNETWHTIE